MNKFKGKKYLIIDDNGNITRFAKYLILTRAENIFRNEIDRLSKESNNFDYIKFSSKTRTIKKVEVLDESREEEMKSLYNSKISELKENNKDKFDLIETADGLYAASLSEELYHNFNILDKINLSLEDAIQGYKKIRDIKKTEEGQFNASEFPSQKILKVKYDFRDWYKEQQEIIKNEIGYFEVFKETDEIEEYESSRLKLDRQPSINNQPFEEIANIILDVLKTMAEE